MPIKNDKFLENIQTTEDQAWSMSVKFLNTSQKLHIWMQIWSALIDIDWLIDARGFPE